MSNISKEFIIDEWLWHDLSGENGEERQCEAIKFLESIYDKCDKIATISQSKFEKKFFDFCKRKDLKSHKIAKFYKNKIFHNSKKYSRVNEQELNEIPGNIISEVNPDDKYLIKLYYKLQSLIITTDDALLKICKRHGIKCEHRDSFLDHYIGKK